MKAFTVAALVGCVLVAGFASAQQPPVKPTVVPPTAPAVVPPAGPQAQPPAAAPAKPAEPKFLDGVKYAFINIQRIAAESAEGKASSAKIEQLRTKRATELSDKNKQIEGLQAKQRSAVLGEDARLQIQKDLDRINKEIERLTQDAQGELQELQNDLQVDFQRKVAPVIESVARDKGLHMLFSQADSGLVWADAGLDLTLEVIRRLDAATAAATPAKK
jgi:outer membrane protein